MNEERTDENQAPGSARRRILLIVVPLTLLALTGLLLKGLPAREPTYDGKPLRYWLERNEAVGYINANTEDPAERECRNALRHIGTNAIPILLEMLQARDSDLKLKLVDLLDRWDIGYASRFSGSMAYRQQQKAVLGFVCLGDLASNSVPAVIAIYNNSSRKSSRDSADSALKAMYPAAGEAAPYWVPLPKRADWYCDVGRLKSLTGEYSNAVRAFSDALKLNSTNALTYRERAEAKFQLKDLVGALSDANRSIQLNRSNSAAFHTKGLCEFALKNFANAEADFTMVINSDTNDFNAYNARGLTRANQRKLEDAFADLSMAISLNPQEPTFHRNCALVETLQKEYEAALADISESIKLHDKDPAAHVLRGHVHNALKDYQAALADYGKALELDPKDSSAYSGRGATRTYLDEFESAGEDLKKALELNPKNAAAYMTRGFLTSKRGGTEDEVLADLEHGVELGSQMPETYLVLGLFQYQFSRRAPALQNCRKALQLGASRGADEARAYIWLIRAQTGDEASANREVEEHLLSLEGAKTNEWEADIGRFLSGSMTESNFLRLATTTAKRPSAVRGQVCESLYYAGMKRKLAGDTRGAAELFQKCLDMRDDNNFGYMNARVEMRTLNKN